MNSWHGLMGKYEILTRDIKLNYPKVFLDPVQAKMTLFHELSHGAVARYEFGQATNNIVGMINRFKHLDKNEKSDVCKKLKESQEFVQEGFATFLEMTVMADKIGKKNAEYWADENLNPYYNNKFKELSFALYLSDRNRDFFTSKISYLAMENGIRRYAQKFDILGGYDSLVSYIDNPDNNPNERLKKMLGVIKYKTWLLTKPIPEIAKECGIVFHELSSRKEVADFLNYIALKAGDGAIFTENDIGDTIAGIDGHLENVENMIIGNLELNISENAEIMANIDDFLFYKDRFKTIFINPAGLDSFDSEKIIFRKTMGEEAEISMVGITKTGEKYFTFSSKKRIAKILNDELRNATLISRENGYSPTGNKNAFSDDIRIPDVVLYGNINNLHQAIKAILKNKGNTIVNYFHLAASEGHPIRTLVMKFDDMPIIHTVNVYGDKGIAELLKELKDISKTIPDDEIILNKKPLNNMFSFWMGLSWEVDWVETIIKKELIYRV